MEHSSAVAIFLTQVILLLTVGRLLGELMERIGQPPVMGQLLAGLLLGHSVLGALLPDIHAVIFPDDAAQKRMLQALSEFGILLLLLLTGMETNLNTVRAMRRTAMSVSLSGIVIPFACGVTLGMLMPAALLPHPELRLPTALFLGTALSISSVKVVAAVVRDMGFLQRRVGRVMISAAIVDDTLAWIIIAVTASLVMHGEVNLATVGMTLLGIAIFLVAAFTVGQRAVVWTIRWANDQLRMEMGVITAIIVLTAAFALATDLLGVHTVLGAFVAGLLVSRSPILTRHVDAQLRGLIVGFFMPIFFGAAGLSADLTTLLEPRMALFAVGLVLIASVGKFLGAYVGGMLGGLSLRECTALACGMNARGSTEIIVASIGLTIGALSQDLFTMIVAMAVLTTLMMPPALRWALARVPVLPHEKESEEREKEEEAQFLPRIERILAVVDRSPSGRLASRLVGHLAGSTRKLTAVMDVEHAPGESAKDDQDHGAHVALETAQSAANATQNEAAASGQPAPEHEATGETTSAEPVPLEKPAELQVEPAPRTTEIPVPEAVARELSKGYDLVLFGFDGLPAENPALIEVLKAIEDSYEGGRAFVVARERRADEPLRILLPVTGADYSRRGAEVAIALAASAGVPLSVLSVSRRPVRTQWHLRSDEPSPEDQATIDAIQRLADRRGVAILPRIQAHDRPPDTAITQYARRIGATLVVLGVKERLGPGPSFGPTAEAVLHDCTCSVLLLST